MGPDTIKEIMCDQPIARLSRPDEIAACTSKLPTNALPSS